MSELLKITVIRDHVNLSPKEIDRTGFKTHPPHLQSTQYKRWTELCKAKQYNELMHAMNTFMNSDTAITRYDQMPKELASAIKFVEYHGYKDFSVQEFAKQVRMPNAKPSKSKKAAKTKECAHEGTPFFEVTPNLSDQLLAMTKVDAMLKLSDSL